MYYKETTKAKIIFLGENDEELYSEDLGTNKDIVISIKGGKVHYPFEFNTFIETILAQRKLQTMLGNKFEVKFDLTEYKTISNIMFVTMNVVIEIGSGREVRNISLPFLCPIDVNTSQELVDRIRG